MAANDLLSRKITVCFGHLDANKNGVVEREDVIRIANHLLDTFGVPAESGKGAAVLDGMLRFWEGIEAACDANADGQITPEEYQKGLSTAFNTTQKADQGFRPMADAIVSLLDSDNDGRISKEEYQATIRLFQVNRDEIDETFNRLDLDGDGAITTDELHRAINEFYLGTDPDAPGNWLFGRAFEQN